MFFFRPRISGNVGSLGAARICLCLSHESGHMPQTSPRNLLGGDCKLWLGQTFLWEELGKEQPPGGQWGCWRGAKELV